MSTTWFGIFLSVYYKRANVRGGFNFAMFMVRYFSNIKTTEITRMCIGIHVLYKNVNYVPKDVTWSLISSHIMI